MTRKKRVPPYYIARRVQSVEELEALLNELREQGYAITWVMQGLETYSVVALLPEL